MYTDAPVKEKFQKKSPARNEEKTGGKNIVDSVWFNANYRISYGMLIAVLLKLL
jgi:hypothetical protein